MNNLKFLTEERRDLLEECVRIAIPDISPSPSNCVEGMRAEATEIFADTSIFESLFTSANGIRERRELLARLMEMCYAEGVLDTIHTIKQRYSTPAIDEELTAQTANKGEENGNEQQQQQSN